MSNVRISDGTLRDVLLGSASLQKQVQQLKSVAKAKHLTVSNAPKNGQMNQSTVNQFARDLQSQLNLRRDEFNL